jgi:hypothetical protein
MRFIKLHSRTLLEIVQCTRHKTKKNKNKKQKTKRKKKQSKNQRTNTISVHNLCYGRVVYPLLSNCLRHTCVF